MMMEGIELVNFFEKRKEKKSLDYHIELVKTYRLDVLLELVGYSFGVLCVLFGDEG
jgi:G:T/U-mismatch repair DNA glycosylase